MLSVERILQLFALLATVVGCLPVLPFLPWWLQLGLGGALLLGIVGDCRGRYLLTAWPATLLSGGVFLAFVLQVSRSNLAESLIQMLCLLLAVRIATEKTARNLLQIFLLATIVLAASSMLTLNMAYLFYLVLVVLLVTSGLLLLSFYSVDPRISFNRLEWRMLLKVMLLLPVSSLLLMLLFFVILPRTQTPLWNFLNPKATATAGMTDQVQPGSISDLAQSSQIAFRVETKRLPVAALYWRGIVLNQLDGKVWKRSSALPQERLEFAPGADLLLNFYSEAKADKYLVTLDHPRNIEGLRSDLSADGVVTGRWRSNRKLHYQVKAQRSVKSRQIGGTAHYLLLPNVVSKRLRDVGLRVAEGSSYREKLAQLEKFFIAQQLSYSNLDLPVTSAPIDTFLFESKRGYCEYFASSFALLLRIAGVPTRLVGGYLGGDYNPLGGYYLVGEDLAHVWVEALDDQGVWQRLDPSRLAVNAEQAFLPAVQQGQLSYRAISDALLHYWSRLVLNYDLRQQFGLLRQVARQVRDIKFLHLDSGQGFYWLLLLPAIALLFLWGKRRQSRDARLIQAYRKQIMRCSGLKELPELGLFDIARLTAEPLCRDFAEIYGRCYYRDQPLDPDAYQRLRKIIRALAASHFSIEVAIASPVGDNTKSDNLNRF